ncbi:MAG: Maf family protein [Oscillospiraceae bacterium]|jgi:septum formation protein|nr:Maf family protein [Oscillospiraceae bacterium]
MSLVLASGSPRRAALLSMLGLTFEVVVPVGEESAEAGLAPAETVCLLSGRKAAEVSAQRPASDLIVAADTLVYLDGAALGKPGGPEEARAMLTRLSGRVHEVYTGVTVARGGVLRREALRTRVTFRVLSQLEIDAYVRSGTPLDKAGAYGIQDRGALFVERIEGDFYNVMGLPLCLLYRMAPELLD